MQATFVCLFLMCFAKPLLASQPKEITIVSDDNYPPYIFRDSNGNLQGILVDEWTLWAEKTGINVNLIGMDWGKALQYMEDGKADVIESIFKTSEREAIYDFSKEYATIEVPVFFRKTLGGITDIQNLKGFTIGVKSGDACIDVLQKNGITTIKEYASYQSVINAAKYGEIQVFTIDKPPALYLLYKMNLENEFRFSFNLYTGKFHRAVKKGNTDLLKVIDSGFAMIPASEQKRIELKWLGESIVSTKYIRGIIIVFLLLLAVTGILFVINVFLRRKIKQKNQKLNESNENYRLLVENSLEAIFVTRYGIIKYTNPLCKMYLSNLYGNDIIGKSIYDFVTADQVEPIKAQIKQLMDGEIPSCLREIEFVGLNNEKIWIRINTVRIMWEGGFATLNFASDISGHKLFEETLQKQNIELKLAKETAIESDNLKTAFLANLSHEIRTPMNGIMGFAELLRLPKITDQKRDKFIEVINTSCKQLLAIITDIIDISKIETNQVILAKSNFNLNNLLTNIHSNFIIRVQKENKIELKTCMGFPNDSCCLETDPIKLQQVISNLVENAIKFTENGTVEFGYSVSSNNIVFYVKDTGIGIGKANYEIIFDRFRQVDMTQTRLKGGTGLGLSICKAYAKLLGGDIWLESEVGKGTTFYFSIPNTFVNVKEQDEEIKIIDSIDLTGKKILVAEDDETNFLYIKMALEGTNAEIVHANDGVETVDYMKNHSDIDLILLDIKMPNKNGIDAAIDIRKTNKTIPIIAQTAYAFNEEKQMVLNTGVNAYLAKPIAKSDLLSVIAKHI